MSTLTDLRSAYQEMLADDQDWNVARVVLHDLLTDDTIRALLEVAQEGVCPICHTRMAEGVYRNEDDEYVACPAAYHAAIAPLVKEATDES